ncbi:hypothetical protein KFU94_67540 [Chloroflexi bacterium TSY]|nr:hypothetical protein [Chloroflexi bacterium TSY]
MTAEQMTAWLGREQITAAILSPETANLMNATLNRKPTFQVGHELPPAWHWLYFHEPVLSTALGVEGHEKLGGFMPPISFTGSFTRDEEEQEETAKPPRRMWAGGRLKFLHPMRLGNQAIRRSTIKSITPKHGRSGPLVFVLVEREIMIDGKCCLCEEQTIVYREATRSDQNQPISAKPAPTDAAFSASFAPDPMLLFRYSTLTFNTHRIHYDVDFCRQHEGYPDLVVHGPLTATLLLDLYHQRLTNKRIATFEYRSLSPLFNPNPFTLNGKESGEAWAANHEGGLAMSGMIAVV